MHNDTGNNRKRPEVRIHFILAAIKHVFNDPIVPQRGRRLQASISILNSILR